MLLLARILIITSMCTLFSAYYTFAPIALSADSALVADYVKNHFIREMSFGTVLALTVIYWLTSTHNLQNFKKVALYGCAIVVPPVVSFSIGWEVGGMEVVWGPDMKPSGAYILHGTQVSTFFTGLLLLGLSARKQPVK